MCKLLAFALLLVFYSISGNAQTHTPRLGENPFESVSGGGIDHVSVENGGLFVHIPILSLPQLGKLNMSFSVTGNGSQYVQSAYCDTDGNCEFSYTHYNPCMEPNTYLGDDGSSNLGFIWDQPHTICGLHHLTQTGGIDDWDGGDGVYSAWSITDPNTGQEEFDQDMLPGLPTNTGEGGDQYQEWNEFKLLDSDGAVHVFGYDQTNYAHLKANDGSGYVLDMEDVRTSIQDAMKFPGDTYSILGPDGVRERFTRSAATLSENMVMSDPSGNSITWTYATGLVDSVGRKVGYSSQNMAATSPAGCPSLPGQPAADQGQTWTVSDSLGNPLISYLLCGAPVTIATNFFDVNGVSTHWCRDDSDSAGDPTQECFYYDETDMADDKLQSVVLPNGTFWGFSYSQPDTNGISYGDLTDIRTPAGGSIHYTYDNVRACGTTFGEEEPILGHVVTSRTLMPLVGPSQSTYYTYLQGDQTDNHDRVIETDNAGNETVHSLSSMLVTTPCRVADTDTKYYQGAHTSGTLLKEVVRNYSTTDTAQQYRYGFGYPAQGSPVGTTDKILDSETTYQDGAIVAQTTYQYDTWFTDVQPLVDTGLSGNNFTFNYSLQPIQPTIVLQRPTSISDGVKTTVANRLASTNSSYAAAGLLYIPAAQTIQDQSGTPVAKTIFGYDEPGSPQGAYGNNTSMRDVSLTSGVPDSVTTTTYNSNGMPVASIDARGNAGEAGNHTTTVTYDSTGIFVSRVDRPTTNGQAHTSYYGTDPTLGVLLWASDENASGPNDPAHTTTYTYDSIGRAVKAVFPPGGGSTQVCFSDETIAGCGAASSPPYTVQVSVETGTSAGPQTTSSEYDGLGRVLNRTVAPGTSIASSVDTTYNSEGQVYSVSNPHGAASAPTDGLTTFTYDALGRKHLQTNPDNTTLQWTYSGDTVTSIDERGNSWQRTSDLAGRLVQVVEPGALNTTYSYDALNNLKCADQWGTATVGSACSSAKVRAFQHDSFSRLLWAQNPETGVICYGQGNGTAGGCQKNGYDSNGNLLYKTDARGVVSSFTYDALNRVTGKHYSDGVTRYQTYFYDGINPPGAGAPGTVLTNVIGRLSHTSDYTHVASVYGYDAMGRLNVKSDCTATDCSYTDVQSATYDLAGNMTSLTYPDGRIVDQVFDGAGRLAKVSNRAAGGTPAYDFVYGTASLSYRGLDTQTDGIQYTAAGAPQSFVLGNGVGQFNWYNSRLQPCHTMVSTPVLGGTVSALLAGTGPGNLLDRQSFHNSSASNPCGSEAGNNGNIWSITDIRPVGNSQSFSYDSLNRLLTGARSDGAYNHTYNYDSFGNMLLHDNLASPSSVAWSIDQATNRLLRSHDGGSTWGDYSYDAGGNLSTTGDGIAPSVSYQYNANNQVLNINSGSTASYLYDAMDQRVFKQTPNGTTDYIYFNNQPIAEKDQTGVWTDYIYANGQKIAKVAQAEQVVTISGTAASSSDYEYFPIASSLTGYLVQAGDKLYVRQRHYGVATGGIQFDTDTAASSYWTFWGDDQDNENVMIDTSPEGVWHDRVFDISAEAGNHMTNAYFGAYVTGAGAWSIQFTDFVVVSSDGSVHPIYTGSGSLGMGSWGSPGMTGIASVTGPVTSDAAATRYYLDDHLGTTQMELSGGGWPVWEGQFTPFGGEIVNGAPLSPGQPDGSSMHYKFTGKERDAESGLDYFGARYYASSVGRWTSPDWADKPEAVPYSSLDNPQSLNLYGYVANNPLSQADLDGHGWITDHLRRVAIGILQGVGILATTPIPTPMPSISVNQSFDIYHSAGNQANEGTPNLKINPAFVPSGTTETLAAVGTIGGLLSTSVGEDIEAGGAAAKVVAEEGLELLKPSLPDAFWEGLHAPNQVEPGIRQLIDVKPSSRMRGEVYERRTYYDEYGRNIGQTHFTHHGEPNVHPNPHHHIRNPVVGESSGPRPGIHPADTKR